MKRESGHISNRERTGAESGHRFNRFNRFNRERAGAESGYGFNRERAGAESGYGFNRERAGAESRVWIYSTGGIDGRKQKEDAPPGEHIQKKKTIEESFASSNLSIISSNEPITSNDYIHRYILTFESSDRSA